VNVARTVAVGAVHAECVVARTQPDVDVLDRAADGLDAIQDRACGKVDRTGIAGLVVVTVRGAERLVDGQQVIGRQPHARHADGG